MFDPGAGSAGTALDTALGGDAILGGLSSYYTPSDGVVGEASALARSATDWNGYQIPAPPIPQFEDAGTFDVVHSREITEFNAIANLTNTAAVADRLVQLVEDVPDAGPLCTRKRSGERTNRTAKLRLPLYQLAGQAAGGEGLDYHGSRLGEVAGGGKCRGEVEIVVER